MKDKHILTDQLKQLETEIHEMRIDLRSINSRLKVAYDYEDDLAQRQVHAKEKTTLIKNEFFKKTGEISEKYKEMKRIFDVFTGNFYDYQ